ncbi:MAG: hypothetical protein ACI8WB_001737 [Phenylobacterium sp.]|jgi:hypothetical protein
MAIEQDIAQKVAVNDNLTVTLNNKLNEIDTRVAQAKAAIDAASDLALKNSFPYRLSRNQRLLLTAGTVPDFWSSGAGITYTQMQTIEIVTPWVDRTELEKELLVAMGRDGLGYSYVSFNIWRMQWSTLDVADRSTLFQQVNASTAVTVAAMTKLISGTVTGHWAEGITTQWSLTGQHFPPNEHGYIHMNPHRHSTSGELLFALPAVIAGEKALVARDWWTFPYIGDDQNA